MLARDIYVVIEVSVEVCLVTRRTLQTVKTLQTVRAGQTVFAIMGQCHLTAHPSCRAGALRPRCANESVRVNGSAMSDCRRWRN